MKGIFLFRTIMQSVPELTNGVNGPSAWDSFSQLCSIPSEISNRSF